MSVEAYCVFFVSSYKEREKIDDCKNLKKQEIIFYSTDKFLPLPRFPCQSFRKEVMGSGKYTYIEKTFT